MQQQSISAFRPRNFDSLACSSNALSLSRVSFKPSELAGPAREPRYVVVKRISDIVLALVFLLLAGLPMLLIAAAIRLTSKGPALFKQERIGLHGKPFVMLKFRTMHHTPMIGGSWPQATRHDPRVTRVGALLRHTSCDELPQLLNVLAGSMSLVGPRPHAPGTCVGGRPFEAISHHYPERHRVKPGMTGLAQIRGWRGETDTEDKLLRRLDSDLEYIATWSLTGDLRIICHTIATVLRMPNAY
jgi:lipopolysaccharide/colanic/teichoic acid biosynthesis glycosyltransferase